MNLKAFLFLLFFSTLAQAMPQAYFEAESWQRGLHLLAGGGLNTSSYRFDNEHNKYGAGLSFKTELGYYLNDRWALEASSNVKFNKTEDYYIWDTLLTLGVRYRFNWFPFTRSKAIYSRAFVGRAPTVFYSDRGPEVFRSTRPARIQYDGDVYGLAFGKMYQTKEMNVWYLEFGASLQNLKQASGIENDGEVPVVAFKTSRNAGIIYGLYASIGLVVF